MTKSIKQFFTFVQNEPLIEAVSLAGNAKLEGSIFVGIGIVSSKDISVAIPFDILGLLFEAELLRKQFDLNNVIVLIADNHAKSNKMFSDKQIDNITIKTFDILSKVIEKFKLSNFKLLKASEEDIPHSIPNFTNQYLNMEIADLQWFSKTENICLKLGWTMEKNNRVNGHDERFFDQEIKKFCPDLSFVHLKPGRTFNKNRQRVSPYLSIAGESRILLEKGENVQEKIDDAMKNWPDPNLGGAIRHLANIVRAFEKLNGNLLNMTLEEKVQFILNKAINL